MYQYYGHGYIIYLTKMDDFIDNIKVFFYNIKHYKFKPHIESFWCKIGFHKMRRGLGWSKNTRHDICLKCNYSKQYKNKNTGWCKSKI